MHEQNEVLESVATTSEERPLDIATADSDVECDISWADVWGSARLTGLQAIALSANATAKAAEATARASRELHSKAVQKVKQHKK